jgi:hypothetical protein
LLLDGERLVIASLPAKAELIRNAIVDISPEEALSVEWLQRVFANDADRILGPAEVNYADETSFRSEPSHHGRALLPSESDAYRALVDAIDPRGARIVAFPQMSFRLLASFQTTYSVQ